MSANEESSMSLCITALGVWQNLKQCYYKQLGFKNASFDCFGLKNGKI